MISRANAPSSPAHPAASARRSREALVKAGAKVGLSGTRVDKLEAVAAEIGGGAVLPCNLSSIADVDKLVPAAEAALGGLDILVNNAGMTRDNLFMRMKDEEWDEVLAVNLTAAFHLTRAVLRGMMKQRFGRIINISSVVGVAGNPGQGNYAATKAGIIGMGKALAYEVASRNITVNAVAPGFIASAMTDELNDKQREAILAKVPAGRLGTADGSRRMRRLSRKRRSRLHHRPHAQRQRRHADAVNRGQRGFAVSGNCATAAPVAEAGCGLRTGSGPPSVRLGDSLARLALSGPR